MPAMYEQIAAELAAQIKSGELQPRDKLPSERDLKKKYGVSGTVIRFVMVDLKARGLVKGEPGRGVFVAEPPEPTSSS